MSVLLLVPVQLFVTCSSRTSRSVERPNIILILSDDMGYSDLGCFGGEIKTPNLDQLADNRLRFTQFYNAARCCPTRASLLTGLYPHQAGIGHMTSTPEAPEFHNYGLPGYRGWLHPNTNTLAEVLKTAGYNTLMTGKWHLGMADTAQWPLQRGFDKYYGILAGASNYFKPSGSRGISSHNKRVQITNENYYTTDEFTTKAIQFIRESKETNGDPFFLYLAYNAPHWPLNAPKEDIEKYKGKYLKGWGELREERFARMQGMGLIDEKWPLSPDDSPAWASLSEEQQNEMDLRMAIYASQVDRMDQNIGKLVNFLKEEQLLNNTILVFINDNGACAEGGTFGGGPKEILETREGFFLTYGQSWANASNTPYREYKHNVHEGGIASPMIVPWPGGIEESRRGSLVREYCFLPDVMATFVGASQAVYPLNKNGFQVPAIEGRSMLPLITGKNTGNPPRPIFWEHEGNCAVRFGEYKLVSKWNNSAPRRWDLYNLLIDRTEMNDLANEMPEKVKEMSDMWQIWATSHDLSPGKI